MFRVGKQKSHVCGWNNNNRFFKKKGINNKGVIMCDFKKSWSSCFLRVLEAGSSS